MNDISANWKNWLQQPAQRDGDYFLPDFCDVRVVLVVVLAAELFALVLALASPADHALWQRLGLISVFILWIVLTSTTVLCRLRPWLMRRTIASASLCAMLTILFMTALSTFMLTVILWMPGVTLLTQLGQRWLLANLAIATIIGGALLRYFYVQQEFRHKVRREAEARIQALQARIHPHFLFNTMNVLASLTRSDPEAAERVVMDLSALFRASLNVSGNKVSLNQELDLCTRYLNIEQIRLGTRLQFEIAQPEWARACKVPLLSLQPLVENAVFHGVQNRIDGGLIRLTVQESAGSLVIEVRNPLAVQEASLGGHGIALDNIRERLRVLYGDQAQLQCGPEGAEYLARLRLPKE